ncbi:MAG: hypothetical protein QOE23_2749 [Pseudonocardiales bacterium]|jgi:hypothetical protein|nr:hypothetical protein [Pseudonocardiales bacterium]
MSDNAFDELCTRLSAALEADGSRLSAVYDREHWDWSLTRGDGEQFYLGRNYDDEVILSLLGLNDMEFNAVRDGTAIVETMTAFVQGRVTVRKTWNRFGRRLEVRPSNGEPFTL